VTTATDVYSLGVLLYSLLTRRSPYADAKDIARAIVEEEPRAASVRTSDPRTAKLLKGDLDNVLAKALKKNPAERYGTVSEFAADLCRYLNGEPVRARAATPLYRARKFIRRRRVPLAAAAALLVAIVAGTAASLVYAHRAQVQRARAERHAQALRKLSESLLFELHDSIQDLAGATQARELLAQRATEYLSEVAAEAGNDPVVLADLAGGYSRLAAIESAERAPHLGGIMRDQAALENNEKALDIWKRLLAGQPENSAIQKGVLSSMWAVAEGKRRQGDMGAAFALHTERLKLVEQWYTRYGRQDLLQSVAASYAALSDLTRTTGDNAGALRNGQKGLELREKLLRLNPSSASATRLVGLSHESLGYAFSAQGDHERAVAEHRQADGYFERLVRARPADAGLRRLLFVAENNLCESLALAGRIEEAMKVCPRTIGLAETAFRLDQINVQTEEDLGSAYSTYALALKRAGRKVEALRWELRAQNVLRQAIERDPDSRDTSLAYLDSCLNLISLERGRVEHCQYAARAWKFANAHARHWPEDAILKERWESAKRAASTCAVQSLQGSTEPRATNWFPVSALH
jgi:tetratricopeptide (TPR) repeat protein